MLYVQYHCDLASVTSDEVERSRSNT